MVFRKTFFVYLFVLASKPALAANETQGGLIVGQFRPGYGTDFKGSPELPATALLKGVYANFIRRDVLIGLQVTYASTNATDNTEGSQYSFINSAVHFGFSYRFAKALDLEFSTGIGLGQMNYSAATSTPISIQASYLSAQPQVGFGLLLTSNFKIALGGAYQWGYVYEVVQSGPSDNFVDKATEKATVGGIAAMVQFALIQ